MIFAIEVEAFNPAEEEVKTLYFATDDLVTRPTDTPANVDFDSCVERLSWAARSLFGRGRTRGQTDESKTCEIGLANADGHLDYLMAYGFAGRPIRILAGEPGAAYPDDWEMVATGTVEQPLFSWTVCMLRFRDKAQIFSGYVQNSVYAGDNVLPAGLEGTPDDLKGKRKPLVFGRVLNMTLPCCNTSRLIYQANDGAVEDVTAVYDGGAALTQGADYTDQTDMESTAPAAGHYRVWPAGGYVRLGSSPAAEITADITVETYLAERAPGFVFSTIATRALTEMGDTASVTVDFPSATGTAETGLVCTDMTIAAALDALANTSGCWWGFDQLGNLDAGQLDAAAGMPTLDLTSGDISTIERLPTGDDDKGVPAWKIQMLYAHNETPQPAPLGVVSDARRAWLAASTRAVTAEDTTVKTVYPRAPEIQIVTRYIHEADAQAEADRLLGLYGARQDRYRVRAHLDAAEMAQLRLGGLVTLYLPRFNMAGGQIFRIIGLETELRTRTVEMDLWGNTLWES